MLYVASTPEEVAKAQEAMKEFGSGRIVTPEAYVKEMLDRGAQTVTAEKSSCLIARPAVPGERILTIVNDGPDKTKIETDETGREGCWVTTAADIHGNPILNNDGSMNTWQQEDADFRKKYDVENIAPDGFVKPRGGRYEFCQILEDTVFIKPWGSKEDPLVTQDVRAGGMAIISDPNNIYGISEDKFPVLYAVVDDKYLSLGEAAQQQQEQQEQQEQGAPEQGEPGYEDTEQENSAPEEPGDSAFPGDDDDR